MLRTIIIDDEQIGISALQILIEKHTKGIRVVATTTDPEKGIRLIEDFRPEVVFLDVTMPKINGFDLLEMISYRDFKLVFTTAHQEYAIKAIKNHAYDYLLKPIDIDELKSCVERIVEEQKPLPATTRPSSPRGLVELSVKDGIIFIKPQDIIRLEASGSYTTFYLENGLRHVVSKNLKECETLLDPEIFCRCHQSHVINLTKVVKMVSANGLFAQMSDGSLPEIGRRNKESFLGKLKHL